MKNKTVSIIYFALSIIFAIYFLIQFIIAPGIVKFSDFWLFLAIIFFIAARKIKQRKSESRYIFLQPFKKSIRITAKIMLSTGFAISFISLYFICTPKINDGTIKTKYVIILGGGVKLNGTLGESAKLRVEKASEYLKLNADSKAIVTEGKGIWAPCTGAPVLSAQLQTYGISKDRIIEEDEALDTIQNFEYSIKKIAQVENMSIEQVLNTPVTVVTSGSHLARSEFLAKRIGFKTVYGIKAPVKIIDIPNVYAREICSYIKLALRILLTGKPCGILPK